MKSFLCLICLLASFSVLTSQRVLIIGIDGCRSDVAETAHTPNLDALKQNGLYSPDAFNDDITISGPGWSAILCGVWSDKHNVTNNNFSGSNYIDYPSIFNYIEDHDSSLNTVSICHWAPINDQIVMQDADTTLNVSSDALVAEKAIEQLELMDPHVMFLHFDEADHAGHSYGFDPNVTQYVQTIETIDQLIGDVIDALHSRSEYPDENWVVLITSDHGGLNFSHGGSSFEEENVIFIASGDSIDYQLIEKDSNYILDDPYNCLADSVQMVFDGTDDYASIPNIPEYNFGSSQDFTIELRVKTNVAADVAIVGNKDWDSGNNKGFVFSFKYPSGPEWKVNIGDGTNRADLNVGGSIADGEWHTLSVSFDRDGQMTMYKNGQFVDETSITAIGDITNGEDLYLGTDINLGYDFNGAIAELRIWDKVIASQEIEDYHCDTISSSHPSYNNLIGYWRLNDDSIDQTFEDDSNLNNHGNMSGASWYEPDSMWVFDFSKTPRIVDIPISALAHLCVPIEMNWELDGNSKIKDCIFEDPDCANPKINKWIGPSSGIWNEAGNWSRGFVPKTCDNVVIEDGASVTIIAGNVGSCYSLCVQLGAELIVESDAELNVMIED